jgi:hypothetical protein
MKAYGVKRQDFGCCPGHDKFPKGTYNNRKSKKARARDKRYSHKVARQEEERLLRILVKIV